MGRGGGRGKGQGRAEVDSNKQTGGKKSRLSAYVSFPLTAAVAEGAQPSKGAAPCTHDMHARACGGSGDNAMLESRQNHTAFTLTTT